MAVNPTELDAIVALVTSATPAGIIGIGWWLEYRERRRLQRVLESFFIPFARNTQGIMRAMNKTIGGSDVYDSGDDED